MHIVQILPELNQGGVERGTVELSRELVRRGHRSTVISAGGSLAKQIQKDGGQYIPLDVCSKNPLSVPRRVSGLRRILQTLLREQTVESPRSKVQDPPSTPGNRQPATPDHPPGGMVLHARSRVPAWLCFFANKRLKIPFVTTVHGFNSVSRYSEIMMRGDRVIYGSSSIRDYIIKNYPVDESRLRYVPRGIDMDYFDPAKTDSSFIARFKKDYRLEGRFIVTVVGRITEWKGHETFIRALGLVQKRHPQVVGVIAGGVWHDKKDYLAELKRLAADAAAEIRFVGSQSQVREIYALSNLAVSAASTKPETFGRTAAEALAMNTPVIASAQRGTLDILCDGENGFFFPPGDFNALANRIQTALRTEFGNMREHISRNFSLDYMVETELEVYRELMRP